MILLSRSSCLIAASPDPMALESLAGNVSCNASSSSASMRSRAPDWRLSPPVTSISVERSVMAGAAVPMQECIGQRARSGVKYECWPTLVDPIVRATCSPASTDAAIPHRPRLYVANVAQHAVQRGNQRQPCFFVDVHRRRYLQDLREMSGPAKIGRPQKTPSTG